MKAWIKKSLILLLVLALALSSTGCVSTLVLYRMLDADTSEYTAAAPTPTATPMRTAAPTPTPDAAPPTETPGAVPPTETPPTETPPAVVEASPTPARSARPESVSFDDMEYVRPDTAGLMAALEALTADVGAGSAPDTWLPRFDEAMALYDDAESQRALAYLLYAFDVTEDYYRDEYEALEVDLLTIDVLLADAAIAILESEAAGSAAAEAWGADFIQTVYLSDKLNSLDVQDLLEEEIALELDYDQLLTTFVYKEGKRTWTLEDLAPAYYAGQIDFEEYFRLYDAICAALNKEAGALFLDLLDVRNEIAASLGYGSFSAYRYDCYERDFTLAESQALHAAVKEDLVPLYYSATVAQQINRGHLDDMQFPFDVCIEQLKRTARTFSPRLAESLTYMLDNGLYDFTVSEKKMEGSFTTYISNYNAPFIFSQWENSNDDLRTVIHELGHFTNDYFNPSAGWCSGFSLDLAEVDSQGLELLMTRYYNDFFGLYADVAEAEMLLDAMYAILSGCMEDEFQQYAYANPDVTLEELNQKYLELAKEYGFHDMYGYTGTEWALIPHSFQSPMYYISYATSMLLSLELWARSEQDFDAARDAYWAILDRDPYAKFRTVAEASGLLDPMLPGTVRSLTEALRTALSS